MSPRNFVSIIALAYSIVGGAQVAQAQYDALSLQAGETARLAAKYIVRSKRCNETGAETEAFRVSQRAAASGKFEFKVFEDYVSRSVRTEEFVMPKECNPEFLANERERFYRSRDEFYKML